MRFPVTSGFMEHESFRNSTHVGIDFAMPNETELFSIEPGIISKIISEETGSSLGNAVFIQLKNGQELVYAHLSKVNVNIGEVISTNQLIGLSGNTGNVVGENGGYHLHLGLKDIDGNWINPETYTPLIQNMGNLTTEFSDNIMVLDAADMLEKALESLIDLTINFIKWF